MLRTQKLGEADRIVTFLTRRTGRVRAVGKGVRRTKSKFGSRLEPFMQVDVQFAHGRTLDIVTQVETIEPFGEAIAADYARYTAGTAMLETADRLVVEGDGARRPAIPAPRRRAARSRRRRARRVARARLISAPVVGHRRIRADVRPVRALRSGRSASPVQRRGGRHSVQRLPGARRCEHRQTRRSRCSELCSPATGPPPRRSSARYRKPASGIVAAYLQWHLGQLVPLARARGALSAHAPGITARAQSVTERRSRAGFRHPRLRTLRERPPPSQRGPSLHSPQTREGARRSSRSAEGRDSMSRAVVLDRAWMRTGIVVRGVRRALCRAGGRAVARAGAGTDDVRREHVAGGRPRQGNHRDARRDLSRRKVQQSDRSRRPETLIRSFAG